MALNTDPTFPPSGLPPYRIDEEWCIGDSLPYINENFAIFDNRTLQLSSTYSNFVNNLPPYQDLLTLLNTLSSNYLNLLNRQRGIATAWVNFKGVDVNVGSNALIYDSYNVASVTRLGDFSTLATSGYVFQINFNAPMVNTNYAVVGSGTIGFSTANGDDQIVGIRGITTNTVNNFQIGVIDAQNRDATESSEVISVAVYGGI